MRPRPGRRQEALPRQNLPNGVSPLRRGYSSFPALMRTCRRPRACFAAVVPDSACWSQPLHGSWRSPPYGSPPTISVWRLRPMESSGFPAMRAHPPFGTICRLTCARRTGLSGMARATVICYRVPNKVFSVRRIPGRDGPRSARGFLQAFLNRDYAPEGAFWSRSNREEFTDPRTEPKTGLAWTRMPSEAGSQVFRRLSQTTFFLVRKARVCFFGARPCVRIPSIRNRVLLPVSASPTRTAGCPGPDASFGHAQPHTADR